MPRIGGGLAAFFHVDRSDRQQAGPRRTLSHATAIRDALPRPQRAHTPHPHTQRTHLRCSAWPRQGRRPGAVRCSAQHPAFGPVWAMRCSAGVCAACGGVACAPSGGGVTHHELQWRARACDAVQLVAGHFYRHEKTQLTPPRCVAQTPWSKIQCEQCVL